MLNRNQMHVYSLIKDNVRKNNHLLIAFLNDSFCSTFYAYEITWSI